MTDDRKPRQLFILIDERKHHYDLMAFESLDSFNRFEDEMSELEEREKFKPHAFVELEPTLQLMKEMGDELKELNDFTSSILEDMEHYFDNKCCPTVDEVNQCAIADSKLRLIIGKYRKFLEGI